MYPVSELYKNKIQENSRTFKTIIEIQHSNGVLFLSDRDLALGTLVYTESSQAGEDFTIGSTVASNISFEILNKPLYSNIEFMGATVIVTIGLETIQGMGLTYEDLKQYTYDELRQFTYGQISGVYEYVPLGRFNIDDVNKQKNTIGLKAIDNMINLDKPYSLSKLGYPATLYQIYVDICNVADVQVGTVTFPNKDYIVQERPSNDLTFRDVLGYIAELAGCFAKTNRNGAITLEWYKPSGIILTPHNRSNFKPSDDIVQIKGIMATVDDTTYLAGSEDYAIDLTENPLLQGGYEIVLPNIFNNVKDTIFTPYTSDWQGNPAIQAGDIITQIDRDGKEYNTLITKSMYKYRGRSQLEAKGLPLIAKGYKGSTNRKIAEIKRTVKKEVGDRLTTLEQLQLNATELIANMLGGYAIKGEDAFYIADNEDLSKAKKVWKWGIGGFGYSENGVNGPYTTAVTADGSIVAMNVAANIITANMVNTGLLRSVDGSTWIDLDDGTFNFKNVLKFIDDKLSLNSTFGDGLMEISDTKGFVAYKDATKKEYTQLYQGGIYRVMIDGTTEKRKEYFYERDIKFLGEWKRKWFDGADVSLSTIENDTTFTPMEYTLQLPSNFIGKKFKILIDMVNTDFDYFKFIIWELSEYRAFASNSEGWIIKITDVDGNPWNGIDIDNIPQKIIETGIIKVKSYFVWRVGLGSNGTTYAVKTRFRMDIIA